MRTATTILDAIKLAVLGTTSVLLLAPTVSAEEHGGGAGQTLMATIHPVDAKLGRVAETSAGTVKFTQGSGKVDVLVQASGIPLGGREAHQRLPTGRAPAVEHAHPVTEVGGGQAGRVVGAAQRGSHRHQKDVRFRMGLDGGGELTR